MRIALVHSFYRSDSPSGENVVVRRQAEALGKAGHTVLVVSRSTDDQARTRLYPLRAAVTVSTGIGSDPTEELVRFRPDVVHVHNLFPNFGTRWLQRWPGPLVATLHNFRPICVNGLLFRGSAACARCLDGRTWRAVRYGCYRDSPIATLPLAIQNHGGLARNRLLGRADRVIALSDRAKNVFAEWGGEAFASKLTVLPNGVEDRASGVPADRRHWSFVGRLSPEKGIRDLLLAWPDGEPLVVVGDGPIRTELERIAGPSVTFAGLVSQDGVDEVLRSSWGLIFPSSCFEGAPAAVVEALMHGTPVIALEGSSGADLIAATGAGHTYTQASQLTLALVRVRSGGDGLRAVSRDTYRRLLGIGSWVDGLLSVYETSAPQASGGDAWVPPPMSTPFGTGFLITPPPQGRQSHSSNGESGRDDHG